MRTGYVLAWGLAAALCSVASAGSGCPDTNGDDVIDSADLNAVLGTFGQSGMGLSGDVNGDNTVNSADLNAVLGAFGTACVPPCGDPEAGDCCAANGTPNCDDAVCCDRVCAADPFCCEVEWDSICADAATLICGACGGCCQPNGSPGCNDQPCQDVVCTTDAFCCNTEWDQLCADQANELCSVCGGDKPAIGACCFGATCSVELDFECTSAGGVFQGAGTTCGPNTCGFAQCPGQGSCYDANGTPGCNDEECCNIVCGVDPFCCNTEWDGLCKDEANELCGNCGAPNAGSCQEPNGSPGCSNADCCRIVCEMDPFCCQTEWDQICADAANGSACFGCGGNLAGNCCTANGTPGCNNASCCVTVCATDPFCCDTQWDQLCADGAAALCPACVVNGDGICGVGENCCDEPACPGVCILGICF